jgi:hypothetical protein
MTTIATEFIRFTVGGFFASGLVSDPISLRTRMLSLVSCPQLSPVRDSYFNGSSV